MEKESKKRKTQVTLTYLHGLGNILESEAEPGALPRGRNNPKVCPLGLYAEQLSGSSFTTPVVKNLRSWLYRIKPSPCHGPYKSLPQTKFAKFLSEFSVPNPQQLRWKPLPLPPQGNKVNFIEGIVSFAGAGSPDVKTGLAIHLYAANASMENLAFYNSDGDLLIGTIDLISVSLT
jgi:homogentisate 1,2-dioxygenase